MSGKFITFEGGEGTGKSTQVQRLADKLRNLSLEVLVTREPGGTALAEKLRSLILSGACKNAGPEAEALLFAAARADHYHRVIKPALDSGKWVVCDRFYDSTRVYQAISGASDQDILQLQLDALGTFTPDVTIILDIETEVAAARAAARRASDAPDRFESEGIEFHRKVRDGFLAIGKEHPQRCIVVGAEGGIDEVAERVYARVHFSGVFA